ncbi:hypothetical protein MBLNU457_4351t1 [Dothideomycetes sp. NU457]
MSEPNSSHHQPPKSGKARQNKQQTCRFYNSKSGKSINSPSLLTPHERHAIRNDPSTNKTKNHAHPKTEPATTEQGKRPPQSRNQAPVVAQSRIVTKPVPKAQLEDPREFQLGQIRRRYSPKEEQMPDATSLTFRMVPSDPDFPYDIEALECTLTVPLNYPSNGKPKLRVTNKEMQRGFQLNVEQGFDEIAASAPKSTLLTLLNRLDKDLDGLLSRPMAQTIKLYRNLETPKPVQPTAKTETTNKPIVESQPAQQQWEARPRSEPVFTAGQKTQAQAKRQADIRQLVARLGKLPTFKQSTDGVTFTVPFTPLKKTNLPSSLQNINTIRLIVPELYNLIPCRIEFPGVRDDGSCKAAEQSFVKRVEEDKNGSLLAHINYMSQHLGSMSATKPAAAETETKAAEPVPPVVSESTEAAPKPPAKQIETTLPDRSHIQVIPRPPEWAYARKDGEQEDWSSDDSYSYDSGDETEDDDVETSAPTNAPTTGPAERGILLSFPALELYGIELLELSSLSITVKCLRCKESQDIERLKNNVQADHTGMKEVVCKKCANSIAAGFRQDLIHTNSSRAGYIDLDGCTPTDMLPSTFTPTCSECSTPYKTGCVSVRGESTLAICRECHRKMTFRIPEVKFLTVSAASERATKASTGRRARENLGSREQNYRPEDCGICHSILIGRKGHGFWEGGKGTRDKTRMSRKDPRKYKRRPGTKVGGGGS